MKYGKITKGLVIIKDKTYNESSEIKFDIDEIGMSLAKEYERIAEIETNMPEYVEIGAFQINCSILKQRYIWKHSTIAESIKDMVYSIIKYSNNLIRLYKEKIMIRLNEKPTDIRQLFSLKEYLDELPSHITEMQRLIESVDDCYELLNSYLYPIEDEVYDDKLIKMTQALSIYDAKDEKEKRLNILKQDYLD